MAHTPFPELRVLLIQARDTKDIEQQEQLCFLERCLLDPEQLIAVNVVRDRLEPRLLEGIDAVMIGGAGEYSVTRVYPWTDDLLALTRLVGERGLPLFGSCWGHQVICLAFGGEVIHDHERAEFGCGEMHLTEAGQQDRLFRSFPSSFFANLGHHDRCSRLPEGAVELAYNESQRNQAFRLVDVPIYGTQFHSELDAKREYERLIRYRDNYKAILGSDEALERIVDSLRDTTEVDHLLFDFLATYAAAPGSARRVRAELQSGASADGSDAASVRAMPSTADSSKPR